MDVRKKNSQGRDPSTREENSRGWDPRTHDRKNIANSSQPQAQAITQCASWRSDGSPPCLGVSSHGWVPVNTHSTPVPGTPGRLWVAPSPRTLHRHQMSPRHQNSFSMVAEQVSVQGESVQPAYCLWCRPCDERNKTTFETHREAKEIVSSVHQCRDVDDCRMHTRGPRGT